MTRKSGSFRPGTEWQLEDRALLSQGAVAPAIAAEVSHAHVMAQSTPPHQHALLQQHPTAVHQQHAMPARPAHPQVRASASPFRFAAPTSAPSTGTIHFAPSTIAMANSESGSPALRPPAGPVKPANPLFRPPPLPVQTTFVLPLQVSFDSATSSVQPNTTATSTQSALASTGMASLNSGQTSASMQGAGPGSSMDAQNLSSTNMSVQQILASLGVTIPATSINQTSVFQSSSTTQSSMMMGTSMM
jgi:hypothetical protein